MQIFFKKNCTKVYFFWKSAEKVVILHRNPDKFVAFDKWAGKISTTL